MQLLTLAALLVLTSIFMAAPVPHRQAKVTAAGVLEHGDLAAVLNFTPDGQGLVVGVPKKSRVIVWDLGTMKQRTVMDHPNTVSLSDAAYSRDGKLLITVGRDDVAVRAPSRVRVWNAATGREQSAFQTRPDAWVALSPDAKLLAVADWDSWKDEGAVKLFDAATAKEVTTLSEEAAPVYRVGFSPDGQTLVASSWDRKHKRAAVRLWDLPSRKLRTTLVGSVDLMFFRFSPDGSSIVTWSWNEETGRKELKLWDVGTGRLKVELKGGRTPVQTAMFSPDGRLLATGGGTLGSDDAAHLDPTEVKLWDTATGKELANLNGHTALVSAVAFSPDGRLLATAGGDRYEKRGELMLWDVDAKKLLAAPGGHSDAVTTLAFAPSGRVLASGSNDGTVRLWNIP